MKTSAKRTIFDVRVGVSKSYPGLFARMQTVHSPTKEALRLMEIGLKWEHIDANPSYFLPQPQPQKTSSQIREPDTVESVAKRTQPPSFAIAAPYKTLYRWSCINCCKE